MAFTATPPEFLAQFAKDYLVPGMKAVMKEETDALHKELGEQQKAIDELRRRIFHCENALTTESRRVVEELLKGGQNAQR